MKMDKPSLRPNQAEIEYLTLAYNKFYDIFDEILDDDFWDRDKYYRFSKLGNAFSIYAELLQYEPLKAVIELLRERRPPMEAEVGSAVFKVVRNILAHFPVFETWEDVYVRRSLVNWNRPGKTIDKFYNKYEGHDPVKYRFRHPDIKKMTYVSINFPTNYMADEKIWLKDLISEREGTTFSMIFMRRIIDTQVNSS
jgi:hypothetical protein